MKKNFILKYGTFLSSVLVTLITVSLAIIFTLINLSLFAAEIRATDIIVATINTAIITPPVVFFFGRLLRKLSTVEKKMRHLATYDQLTGVLSRHAVMDTINTLISFAKRNNHDFAVIYFDLDHFKQINDTYGHDAGDLVLKECGKTLNEVKRDSDVVGRIGGEEFLIALPDTNYSGAMVLAERLKRNIANMAIHYNEKTIQMTSSMGIADYSQSKEYKTDTLIKFADECLYKSKNDGRNRISVYIKDSGS
jgi:diguanylate cyclase (GGDEF)-like protein